MNHCVKRELVVRNAAFDEANCDELVAAESEMNFRREPIGEMNQ